jgi:hypothetical protein
MQSRGLHRDRQPALCDREAARRLSRDVPGLTLTVVGAGQLKISRAKMWLRP